MKIRFNKINEELEDYPKYKVSSYYDYDKRGLENDFETDDREEAKDKAWEFFQKGGVVVIENNYTGKEVTLPDDEIEYIEDGSEFLNDFFNEVGESYKRKGLKEDYKGEIAEKVLRRIDRVTFKYVLARDGDDIKEVATEMYDCLVEIHKMIDRGEL